MHKWCTSDTWQLLYTLSCSSHYFPPSTNWPLPFFLPRALTVVIRSSNQESTCTKWLPGLTHNYSLPFPSHHFTLTLSCTFTTTLHSLPLPPPPLPFFHVFLSTHWPIVRSWTGWNLLSVNCSRRHDFPTPDRGRRREREWQTSWKKVRERVKVSKGDSSVYWQSTTPHRAPNDATQPTTHLSKSQLRDIMYIYR